MIDTTRSWRQLTAINIHLCKELSKSKCGSIFTSFIMSAFRDATFQEISWDQESSDRKKELQEKLNCVSKKKIIDQKGGKGLEKGKCMKFPLLKTKLAIYSYCLLARQRVRSCTRIGGRGKMCWSSPPQQVFQGWRCITAFWQPVTKYPSAAPASNFKTPFCKESYIRHWTYLCMNQQMDGLKDGRERVGTFFFFFFFYSKPITKCNRDVHC